MYRSAFQMYEHCSIQTSSCSWNVVDFNIVTNAIAIGHHIVLESTLMWGSLQNRLGPFFLLSGLSVCVHWMGRIGVICYLLSLLSSLFLSVTPLLILSPNNRIELELQDITYRLDSLFSFCLFPPPKPLYPLLEMQRRPWRCDALCYSWTISSPLHQLLKKLHRKD